MLWYIAVWYLRVWNQKEVVTKWRQKRRVDITAVSSGALLTLLFQLELVPTIAFSSKRIAFISSLSMWGEEEREKNGRVFLNLQKKITHEHVILPQKYSSETVAMAVCWPKFSTLLNSAGDVGRYLSCQQFLSYWDHFIKHNSTPSVSTRIVNSDLNLVRHDICQQKNHYRSCRPNKRILRTVFNHDLTAQMQ